MNRLFGILVTCAWLYCMAALFQRDVAPFWQTQDPPGQPIPPGAFQVAIRNDAGRRLGTTWVRTSSRPSYTTVFSTTRLNLDALSNGLPIRGKLYFDTDLLYGDQETLQEFTVRLETPALAARVEGVRYDQEFACTLKVGELTRQMAFNGQLSKYLGDSIRPFTYLRDLHVGQSWRIRLIDPLALIMKGSLDFQSALVRVTRRESIEHQGRSVECFRIETDATVAWADDSGRVLRQEVRIPLLGTWILTDEPFDPREIKLAKEDVRLLREARSKDITGEALTGVLPVD